MSTGVQHPVTADGDPPPISEPAPSRPGRFASPWTPILAVYCLYVLISFINGMAGGERQFIGAIAFLGFLAVHAAPRLFPLRLTGLTLALLLAALIPAVPLFSGNLVWGETSLAYAAKYYALLFLILAADALQLPPLPEAPARGWGLGTVAGTLLLGSLLGIPAERVEGSYVNPNNFALAAMSVLFFSDPARDRGWFKLLLHIFVVAMILLSGTTGALLGYFVGLGFSFLHTRWARSLSLLLAAGVLLALLWRPERAVDTRLLGEAPLLGPVWTKAQVIQDHFADLAAGTPLNLWEVGREYGGAELTSAAWRLMHWRRILEIFQDSPPLMKWFGWGPGASPLVLNNLPHNDYLRFLIETGLCGLVANGAVWVLLYRRARPAVRWLAIMMAAYAFTENNLDNFTVMSLFVLFLVGADARSGAGSLERTPCALPS